MDIIINEPKLWIDKIPIPQADFNKYDRGSALISGGDTSCTGATKLAALAALRIGAGLVSIACPINALYSYSATALSVMTKPFKNLQEFEELYSDKRISSALVGPGNSLTNDTKLKTLKILKKQIPLVIDADAITVFQNNPKELFNDINSPAVLTPHEGEFQRIFNFQGNNELRAMQAAKLANCVIVLKGSETIIASPEGKIVKNKNACAYLATAGSGDVLAGIICGLIAQKIDIFTASCIATYIHGQIGKNLNIGMISQDMPDEIPKVLKSLL